MLIRSDWNKIQLNLANVEKAELNWTVYGSIGNAKGTAFLVERTMNIKAHLMKCSWLTVLISFFHYFAKLLKLLKAIEHLRSCVITMAWL